MENRAINAQITCSIVILLAQKPTTFCVIQNGISIQKKKTTVYVRPFMSLPAALAIATVTFFLFCRSVICPFYESLKGCLWSCIHANARALRTPYVLEDPPCVRREGLTCASRK